jgi:Uncharacterised nucleotidyltransferase
MSMHSLNKSCFYMKKISSLEENFVINMLRGLNCSSLMHQELDWSYVVKISEYHRISSLVLLTLKNMMPNEAVENALSIVSGKLNEKKRFSTYDDERLEKLLLLILGLQKNSNTEIFLMGDFILKYSVYPCIKLREISYIEAWIKCDDIDNFIDLLNQNDFSVRMKDCTTFSRCEIFFSFNQNNHDKFNYYEPTFDYLHKDIEPHKYNTISRKVNNIEISTFKNEYFLLNTINKLYVSSKLEFALRDLIDINLLTQQRIDYEIDMEQVAILISKLSLHEPAYFWFKIISYVLATSHLDSLLNQISPFVKDSIKQEVRCVGDNINILVQPGQSYIYKVQHIFLRGINICDRDTMICNLIASIKHVLIISERDFEKLYLEKISNKIDSRIRYISHLIRILPYCYNLLFMSLLAKIKLLKLKTTC